MLGGLLGDADRPHVVTHIYFYLRYVAVNPLHILLIYFYLGKGYGYNRGGGDSLQESGLSFHHMGSEAQVVRLGSKFFYPLSPLTSPSHQRRFNWNIPDFLLHSSYPGPWLSTGRTQLSLGTLPSDPAPETVSGMVVQAQSRR